MWVNDPAQISGSSSSQVLLYINHELQPIRSKDGLGAASARVPITGVEASVNSAREEPAISGLGASETRPRILSLEDGAIVVILTVIALLLLTIGGHDYPYLHTILDTGMCLLSGMVALLMWDIGRRVHRPFLLWLAASFGVTSALEFVHV